MGDEEGFESFEINDIDLEYALNPERRHRQTKDQAIYGMWAQKEDSDDDDGQASFKRRKKDYSAPMNFVSGGIKVGNAEPPSTVPKDDPLEPDFVRPPRVKKMPKHAGANVMAGMRSSASHSSIDQNKLGDWLKFSKGDVVSKMMEKMGYQHGTGLGKEKQGIVEPVQAAVRAGRGAVGAYGREVTGPKFGESAADAQKRIAGEGNDTLDSTEERQRMTVKGSWKKAGAVKTKYRTMDEVIQEGGSFGTRTAKQSGVKVIDMTGSQPKVYSGYDSFSMKAKSEFDAEDGERNTFDLPELRHNLNLLLDLTEENIRRNDKQLRSLKDETVALEHDLVQCNTELTHEENDVSRVQDVFNLIEKFTQGSASQSMNECQELFNNLRRNYSNEYKMYDLEAVAIPCVLPLIRSFFADWDPLDPDKLVYGVDLMKEWRQVLCEEQASNMFGSKHKFDSLPAYERLLWEGWLPSLRRAALRWDPRDAMESMLRIVETWLPILPDWMRENVLEQVVIPRIADRVENWDPLSDTVPIHSWIVPWSIVLGDRLKPVLSPIRQKLAKALRMWSVMDRSAFAILQPWINIWSPVTLSTFLTQNIVPKLQQCLENMNLNPNQNKCYEEWSAVMLWKDMLNPAIITGIVTKFFFPRWFELLSGWLDERFPTGEEEMEKYSQIKQWYFGWDSRIPAEMKDEPTIKEHLRRGLAAMFQSERNGVVVSRNPPPMPNMQPLPPPMEQREYARPAPQLSLKEMVVTIAERYGLTHVPQVNRQVEGRQVYWFGSISIYIDRDSIYAMDTVSFTWRMITIEELLKMSGVN